MINPELSTGVPQMIVSIGNSYTAGIFARANIGRSNGATFDTSASASSLAPGQTASSPTVQSAASASSASDSTQPDFTSMTSQELHDWTNDQLKSGKMSFDDGTALSLMSGKIPVEGPLIDHEMLTKEKVNFIDLAQKGIAGAQSRGDQQAVARLQKALAVMGVNQKSTKTDDISTAESSVKLKEALEAFNKDAIARQNQPVV